MLNCFVTLVTKSVFHVYTDVNLMVENVMQKKIGILITVMVNAKKTINDSVYKEDYACNLSICMCLRI